MLEAQRLYSQAMPRTLLSSILLLAGCVGAVSSTRDAGDDAGDDDAGAHDAGERDAGERDAGPDCEPPDLGDASLRARLTEAFLGAQNELHALAHRATANDDTEGLYNAQLYTAQLLMHAEYAREVPVLVGLAATYLGAFDGLHSYDSEHFYYAHPPDGGPVERDVWWPVSRPVRYWHGRVDAGSVEQVLSSAQFLWVIARLVRITADMPSAPAELVAFVQQVREVLVTDHLQRWIEPDPALPGRFQRRGWGCNSGTYSHREHLQNLLTRAYGTAALPDPPTNAPSYCNAVFDEDLWIIADVLEVLGAHHANPTLLPLSPEQKASLTSYAQLGLSVIRSRLAPTRIDGGLDFDEGIFDDYEDNAWTGYTATSSECGPCKSIGHCLCAEFPGWIDAGVPDGGKPQPALPRRPAKNVGWDISHARRFVAVFDSIVRHRALVPSEAAGDAELRGLARQFATAVWNGDTRAPHFTNFFDGTNGWYRVNYDHRPAFAYPPNAMDEDEAWTSGYGFWAQYEPLLAPAMSSAFARYDVQLSPRRLVQALPEQLPYRLTPRACPWR